VSLESEFLRSCLGNCLIAVSDLDRLNRAVDDPDAATALRAARRHLERCVEHCEFAYKLA